MLNSYVSCSGSGSPMCMMMRKASVMGVKNSCP